MTDVSDRAGASGLAGEESTSKAAEVQQKVQEGARQVLGQVERARGQMGERLRGAGGHPLHAGRLTASLHRRRGAPHERAAPHRR